MMGTPRGGRALTLEERHSPRLVARGRYRGVDVCIKCRKREPDLQTPCPVYGLAPDVVDEMGGEEWRGGGPRRV